MSSLKMGLLEGSWRCARVNRGATSRRLSYTLMQVVRIPGLTDDTFTIINDDAPSLVIGCAF